MPPKKTRRGGNYSLNNNALKVPNGRQILLQDVRACIEVFDLYFPNFSTEITSLPEIENCPGGVLYGHVDEEDNPLSQPTKDKFKESGYKGEVFDFYCSCIGNLEESHGLLINGFDQVVKRKIIRLPHEENKNFEIDWLYFNNDKLVVIEVGRRVSSKRFHTKTVSDKIKQMATRSRPEVQSLIRTISNSLNNKNEKSNTLKLEVQYLICVTNNNTEEINSVMREKTTLKELKNNGEFEDFIKNLYFLTKETVDFMTSGQTSKACLYQWAQNEKRVTCSLPLKDFFANRAKNDLPSKELKYIASVLSIGKMLFEMVPKANPRFIVDQKNFCFEKHLEKCTIKSRRIEQHKHCGDFYNQFGVQFEQLSEGTALVLSPQQLKYLQKDPRRLYIVGEAGSGKTTMLLVKLLQCCGLHYCKGDWKRMKRVLFLIPKSKVLFHEYLNDFISKHCHGAFVEVKFIDNFHFDGVLSNFEVVLCDEVYEGDHSKAIKFDHQNKECIWISQVGAGENQSMRPDVYEIVFLRTLFRSSSHIATNASYLLDMHIIESEQRMMTQLRKAEATKAFASSQTCIDWKIVNSLTEIRNDPLMKKELSLQARVFSVGYDEKKIRITLGTDIVVLDNDLITKEDVSPVDYHFTGVEYERVILILGRETLPIHVKVGDVNCLQLLYNVMTRSVNTFTLFVSKDYKKVVSCLREMKTQRQKINYAIATRNGKESWESLKNKKKDFSIEEIAVLVNTSFIKTCVNYLHYLKNERKQEDGKTTLAKSIVSKIAKYRMDHTAEMLLAEFLYLLVTESITNKLVGWSLDSINHFVDNYDDRKVLVGKNFFQRFGSLRHAPPELLIEIVERAKTSLSTDKFNTFMTCKDGFLDVVKGYINDEPQEASKVVTYLLELDVAAQLLTQGYISDVIKICCQRAPDIEIADQLLSSLSEDQRYSCLLAAGDETLCSTAMHEACSNPHNTQMCRWVHEMDKKYSPNGQPTLFQNDSSGCTPLLLCHLFSKIEFIKFFEVELYCDSFKDTSFLNSLSRDFLGDNRLFMNYNWEVKSYMFEKIHKCYQRGEADRVPFLLQCQLYGFFREVWKIHNKYSRSQQR